MLGVLGPLHQYGFTEPMVFYSLCTWVFIGLVLIYYFCNGLLTHDGHFAVGQFGHRATDWNLQWCDIECGHIIFAATFIVIVDDILSDIIVGARIFDVRFTPSTIHNKYQHQDYRTYTKAEIFSQLLIICFLIFFPYFISFFQSETSAIYRCQLKATALSMHFVQREQKTQLRHFSHSSSW